MSKALPLIIDSFAGGGGASTGIEQALGRSPDVAINHNAAALALHAANHPETLHLSNDIWEVDPVEVAAGRPVGLLWASPDCFPAGTMILTDLGYRAIETIAEGDRVLTHAGRYRRVYATMQTAKTVRQIDVQGVPAITVSDEHPFYARAMHNIWDNANRRYKRTLALATWVLAKDLRAGAAPMNAAGGDRHFCATPCSFGHVPIPEVGGRGIEIDDRLMWLAGRYVGDGWSRLGDYRAELVITCGKLEADGLAEKLALWPRSGDRAASNELAWHRRDTKTAHQFSTNHRGLVEWLRDQFGHGGSAKSFPAWALSAPKALRHALLAGYVSADGSEFSVRANRVTETVTISKALALSTKALAESLGFTATISQPRKNTSVIDGRTVNAKPTYMVRWRENPLRSQTVRDELHNWSRVQSVGAPAEQTTVFNISVEEDETYIADGIVVHNCKHFSKAKGGKPRDRNIRDLAWIVVRWAEQVRPDVILMENVEEFRGWGPIGNEGQPIKELEGQTFELWVKRLRKAGYKVQWRELRACDYGAPTIRKRFFMIARRDGRPIVWPKPTHGEPDSWHVKRGLRLPWRTAAECIDWSHPCPSIFDTKEQIKAKLGLTAVRPLANNTMARVARGMKRYVIDADRPFLVNLTHGGRNEDAGDPFRTITGARRGEKAVVAPSITRFNGGATGQDLREPMATVTANSFIKRPGGAAPLGMIAPILSHLYTSNTAGGEGKPDRPLKTVTAGGGHHAVVAPVLTYAQQGGANRSVTAPHHTICANSKDQNAVIVPSLISIAHGDSGGRREYPLTETIGVVTSGGIAHALVAPTLLQTGYGEAPGQAPRSLDLNAPLGTVVAGGVKHATAAAYLAQQNGGPRMDTNSGHEVSKPISTIAASGSHQTPITAFFAKYYGAGTGAAINEPCHTVTVNDRFGHVEAELQAPPFTEEHVERAREVADFLRAHDAWDDRELVTIEIDGASFVIVDIGMRMLTPRELFNAQGFPKDYVIEGVWQQFDDEWAWVPFSKSVQVSCCGNSVCPDLAEAVVRANCGHLAVRDQSYQLAKSGVPT